MNWGWGKYNKENTNDSRRLHNSTGGDYRNLAGAGPSDLTKHSHECSGKHMG